MATTAFTLIDDDEAKTLQATLLDERVLLAPEVLREALGWELRDQGLCRGPLCVPVADPEHLAPGGRIDLCQLAEVLGRPLALAAREGVAVLGTAAPERASRLASLEAPDFSLPDLEGRLHTLAEQRGKKVLLIAYASW